MDFILKMSYLKNSEKYEVLAKNKNVIFMGQSVVYQVVFFVSLKDVPKSKKIEIPVMEEVQTGMAIGMALNGYIPVSCYPRFDFLILAANQLTNHLDKIDYLTNNNFKSKILIRTMIGSTKPLNAGYNIPRIIQMHLKNYCNFLKLLNLIEKMKFLINIQTLLAKNKKSVHIYWRWKPICLK